MSESNCFHRVRASTIPLRSSLGNLTADCSIAIVTSLKQKSNYVEELTAATGESRVQKSSKALRSTPEASNVLRTLFISDVHLGTKACQADALLDFLREHDAETIYLVGDIIDFWRVRRGAVWPQSHNDVLQKILRKVRKGTKVIFIPGNHDEALRDYCGMTFGGIELHRDYVHVTADGRRFLVIHGDEFDAVVRYARWLAFLGDRSYEFALWCNHPLNWVRRRLGFGYWSLSAYLKSRVKSAVNFIGEFEAAIADEAGRRDADGVICGHIHHAADRMAGGIRYINCGDWVESHTAIAEDHDGRLHLIRWQDRMRQNKPASLPAPERLPLADLTHGDGLEDSNPVTFHIASIQKDRRAPQSASRLGGNR